MESICVLQNERRSACASSQATGVVMPTVTSKTLLTHKTLLPLLLPFKYMVSRKKQVAIWAVDKIEADELLYEFLADPKHAI
jgi:hypothetical protein